MSPIDEATRRLRPSEAEATRAWQTLVDEHLALMDRVGGPRPTGDVWAPMVDRFRPSDGAPDPESAVLAALAEPGDTWLDIGAGGGRFAVPLARAVRRVVAIEPSAAMRGVLRESIAAAGRSNVAVLDVSWPPDEPPDASTGDPAIRTAEVALAANVLYGVPDIAAFLDAMEGDAMEGDAKEGRPAGGSGRRLCVAVLGDRGRGPLWPPVWAGLYEEQQTVLPGVREFVALLGARDRRYDLRTVTLPRPLPVEAPRAQRLARRLLRVEEGTPRDRRLAELLAEHYGTGDGRVLLPSRRRYNAIISWEPAPPPER